MAKDVFYFTHDYEPLSDPKLLALVGEYGASGYGIYWRIVEMLHSDDDHCLEHERYIYSAVAKQMSTPVEQVEQVLNYSIEVCKLFVSDGSVFWSERVFKNIGKREEIVESRRKAGRASAEARKKIAEGNGNSTHVEHELTHVEHFPTKERKGKESKVNEIKEEVVKKTETAKRFQPPSIEEVKLYCLERGNLVDPTKWISHYEANGWKVGRNPMKDWKAAVKTWETNGFSSFSSEKKSSSSTFLKVANDSSY